MLTLFIFIYFFFFTMYFSLFKHLTFPLLMTSPILTSLLILNNFLHPSFYAHFFGKSYPLKKWGWMNLCKHITVTTEPVQNKSFRLSVDTSFIRNKSCISFLTYLKLEAQEIFLWKSFLEHFNDFHQFSMTSLKLICENPMTITFNMFLPAEIFWAPTEAYFGPCKTTTMKFYERK